MTFVRALFRVSGQTSALMAFGDVLAQKISSSDPKSTVDWNRTARFAAVGAFVVGPTLNKWYGLLNKYVGSSGKAVVVKKMLIDQLVFAPTFIVVFLSSLKLLEGKKLDEVKDEISKNYIDILSTNYYLWPWVQLTNFYLIPLRYQVLYVQSFGVLWNTYLSWKTHK